MANAAVDVRLRIEGHHLPGRRCGPYDEVHVGLQVGRDALGLVPGDAEAAVWETALSVVDPPGAGAPDVRGAAVQGRRGDRFAYLSWGSAADGEFTMFRRAKLPLGGVPELLADDGHGGGRVGPAAITARVDLTDDDGMPRCARLGPTAVTWSRS